MIRAPPTMTISVDTCQCRQARKERMKKLAAAAKQKELKEHGPCASRNRFFQAFPQVFA